MVHAVAAARRTGARLVHVGAHVRPETRACAYVDAHEPACVLHPRMGQFMQFATLLARHDLIAPTVGTRRLASYLASMSPLSTAA